MSAMLFFVNTAVRVGEECNVSKENGLICFNIMINEKSQKTNKFELKLCASRVTFLSC